ncbi:hypothetical protein LJB76_02130 [Clostridia bacterium OttesenSCG-928-O13]|nr:hypothetical protein [Clostridia bacterium OttesenSCG-928-O13]
MLSQVYVHEVPITRTKIEDGTEEPVIIDRAVEQGDNLFLFLEGQEIQAIHGVDLSLVTYDEGFVPEHPETVESIVSVASIAFVALAQEQMLDDVTIAEHPTMFPVWNERWTGKAGTILQDDGRLYRSIHDVGPGQNTKPSTTPAMWTLIGDPTEEWPEWIQPLGAHDAYPNGAKVSHPHGERRWVSEADNNIWEPGVYGWKEEEE